MTALPAEDRTSSEDPTPQPPHARTSMRARLVARLTHERVVAALATVVSVCAFVWYYSHGEILLYKDAVSHMMIARRVIFSRTPGLGQLGTVWPPLSHLLMLPFVWIEPLYRSGLAGAIPSMAFYIIATIYIFRAARLLFSSALAGWVAAAVFGLNPNILYLQSTPMTELVLLGSVIVGLFYLFRWIEAERPLDLVYCAGAFAAGTLVRYDAWALSLAELAVVGLLVWLRHGVKAAEGAIWMYGAMAYAGCVMWFLYTWALFGDPMYSVSGPYSSSYQQQVLKSQGLLPAYHNVGLAVREYLQAGVDLVGWPLLALGVIGTIAVLLRYRFAPRMLGLYAVWSLVAFNVLALFLGFTNIETPEVHTYNGVQFANVRYGIMVLPAVALFTASLTMFRRELAIVGMVVALLWSGLNPLLGLPATVRGPSQTSHWAATDQEASWFDQHYHGGTILIGAASSTSLVFATGLPDQDFLNENSPADFNQAIAAPQNHATWIIMDTGTMFVYDAVQARLSGRTDWKKYYTLRATIDGIQFYERVGAGGGN